MWARGGAGHRSKAASCSFAVACCCLARLLLRAKPLSATEAAAEAARGEYLALRTVLSADECPATEQEAAGALPYVLLIGRSCLHWAQQLQLELPLLLQPNPNGAQWNDFGHSLSFSTLLPNCDVSVPMLRGLLTASMQCFAKPSVAQQLAASGVNPQRLTQAAAEAVAAQQQMEVAFVVISTGCSSDVGRFGAALHVLLERLRAVGVAFTSVPIRAVCNNPGCRCVSGPTELGIIAGRGHKCGGCKTAYFCSPDCLRQHWKQHQPVCKALAAATNAVAAAPASSSGHVPQ